MIRIKNTAEDRSKSLLHRTAPKFELEPSLGGQRIRIRSFIDITEDHYAKVKHIVDVWVKAGMVEVVRLDGSALPEPTVKWEVQEEAGNLTDTISTEVSTVGAEVIKEALELPSVTKQILPATPVEETVAETTESAGAPVAEVQTPAPAPAVEEKSGSSDSKKGPGGKKKLF